MPDAIPDRANIVIVGAGAIGCSIAWALARHGLSDIVVLEKSGITHGSTWHAAGLVGQYRSQRDLSQLMQASVALYDEMEAETPIDWKRSDSLRLAASPGRWQELRDAQPIARSYDIDFELITADEARGLFPHISTSGLHGAAFIAGDGYIDPTSLTQAYAARARRLGVRFVENCTVQSVERDGDRITAVKTDLGRIAIERLVLASGVWVRALGQSCGLKIAVAAVEHQYVVTEKHGAIEPGLPVLRDPDANFYVKPEVGGLAIGGWETGARLASGGTVPTAFGRELYDGDLERLTPLLEAAGRRLPIFNELGIRQIINGPIPVSPDGEPIVGPAPGLSNTFVAAGFTSGIAASGGVGIALAEWMVDGAPPFALPSLDPTRFIHMSHDDARLNTSALTAYSGYYALADKYQPNEAREGHSSPQ